MLLPCVISFLNVVFNALNYSSYYFFFRNSTVVLIFLYIFVSICLGK